MRTLPKHSGTVALAVIATGAGVLLGFAGWPQPDRTLEFSGLILAAILTSVFAVPLTAKDWTTMPPSFVIECASWLLLGPQATILVAGAGALTQRTADSQRSQPPRRLLLNAVTVVLAT